MRKRKKFCWCARRKSKNILRAVKQGVNMKSRISAKSKGEATVRDAICKADVAYTVQNIVCISAKFFFPYVVLFII